MASEISWCGECRRMGCGVVEGEEGSEEWVQQLIPYPCSKFSRHTNLRELIIDKVN